MKLTKQDFLSEGKFRKVYTHPDNPNLCIKLGKPLFHKRALNRELYYLKKHQDALPFLSAYHGTVQTNLGLGYIFKIVRNSDNSISRILEKEVLTLDSNILTEKLFQMYHSLLKRGAAIGDFHARNILVRWISKTDYELWIIDGFGNSDFVRICDYSRFLLNKKLIRKFNSLCNSIDIPEMFPQNSPRKTH
ncbi:YrbL family protein [Rubritalea sp.]|uniref:YrbL family protein n=1 Tax=Rubritalea sp. TaxID=2109375 RepID=UPI003EF70BAE